MEERAGSRTVARSPERWVMVEGTVFVRGVTDSFSTPAGPGVARLTTSNPEARPSMLVR